MVLSFVFSASLVFSSSIDAFIMEKLEKNGLKPAPAADRVSLIRRATFDLTGLPPTPEEVDDFLKDDSSDPFGKVMERLLASPRYGEKWGRHWLDVVRYADTDGYSNDYERPNAWRYRDYVIRSFNQDKPYDQFILEQLAGDELDPNNPEYRIATGFLRMGPWEQTSMSVAAVTRQQFLDDVTNTTGTAFLAVAPRCARCHDHKFDPIPARDYYRVQAVFAPVQLEQCHTPFLSGESQSGFDAAIAEVKERIESNEQRRKELERQVHQRLIEQHQVSRIEELPRDVVRDAVQNSVGELVRAYRKRVEYYRRELQRYQPLAFCVSSGGLEKKVATPDTHILMGGSLESPGEKVLPGVFTGLHKPEEIPETTVGRRLGLAQWIADPAHPLTARVMVNRIWQYHFGRGIVKTANNFGKMGGLPTHPELLDGLARYFVEKGWSIKAMHRLIMKSAVYQRSAEHPQIDEARRIDPENKLLSYFSPRRLEAEELRDAVLSVAGELNLEAGGPGVFPEINRELALQPRQIMGTIAPAYEPSRTRAQRNRRSIYMFQPRNLMNPMLEVFNAPNSNESCERREASTVTPQVFNLFNGELMHDMALAMAKNLERKGKTRHDQIELAFRLALGRAPSERERVKCLEHVAKMTEYHAQSEAASPAQPKKIVRSIIGELSGKQFDFEEDWDPAKYEFHLKPHEVAPETRALAELCLVLLNSNEFVYVY